MNSKPIRFGAFFVQSPEFWHGIQVERDYPRPNETAKRLTANIRSATGLAPAA